MAINPVTPIISDAGTARADEHHHPRPRSSEPNAEPHEHSRFEAVAENGNEIVYRAVDSETGAVLAQVPSEEVLRVAKRLQEMIAEGTIK